MPSVKFFTLYDVSSGLILPHRAHVVRLPSFFLMMYPVSGAPPSLVGGFHDNLADVLVRSEIPTGPVGLEGGPKTHNLTIRKIYVKLFCDNSFQ